MGATGKYLNRTDAEISENILDAASLSDLKGDELAKQGEVLV